MLFLPLLAPARRRSAFTLVEVLVVIAILAILAALIFPAIQGALNKGHQNTSISNLRQWWMGMIAVTKENGDRLPLTGKGARDFENEEAWYNAAARKVGVTPVKAFNNIPPPKHSERSVWNNPAAPPPASTNFYFNYGMNDQLMRSDGDVDVPLSLTSMENLDITILMAEVWGSDPFANPTTVRAYFGKTGKTDPVDRMDNSANFLFCNGTVRSFQRKDFNDPNLARNTDAIEQRKTQITWLPTETK